jgi:hypothetical protein
MRIDGMGFAWFLMLTALLAIGACAGGQKGTAAKNEAAKSDTAQVQSASIETVQQAKPLATKFDNVVFKELQTTNEIKKDYTEALGEFEASVISHLKSKNAFAYVERERGMAIPGKSLQVGINITDMRIASFGARFWGGVFAGNSFMNVELDLVDANSGRSLHTEKISSSTNAWGATYSFGASDRGLPKDMGQIVAEYLYTVVPGNK